MPFMGEHTGDLIVWHSALREFGQAMDHFVAPGEGGDRIDPHLCFEIGDGAAAPYDPGQSDIPGAPAAAQKHAWRYAVA